MNWLRRRSAGAQEHRRSEGARDHRRADGLSLRRALSDRLLPALVASMTFLAALALAGAVGASLLAGRWSSGAASVLTVQVPRGEEAAGPGSRIDAVMALLQAEPAFALRRRLGRQALIQLLRPWLGDDTDTARALGTDTARALGTDTARALGTDTARALGTDTARALGADIALALPAVVQLHLRPGAIVPPDLAARLERAAPGTLLERNAAWSDRLVVLGASLQACAGLALLVVAGVAVAVVAVATRAALAARRQAIEIVHGLGASDGYIAGRFAGRATRLALLGGIAGTLLSVPLLLELCRLGSPFAAPAAIDQPPVAAPGLLQRVPLPLWIALPLLPVLAAAIGWGTAQATVRTWLRRLP